MNKEKLINYILDNFGSGSFDFDIENSYWYAYHYCRYESDEQTTEFVNLIKKIKNGEFDD